MYVMKIREPDLILISESLKAIAHPSRIGILKLLGKTDGLKLSVNEIASKLKLSQPEVSRHLSILKNKGILIFNRVGSNIYYSINKNTVIYNWITNLLSK